MVRRRNSTNNISNLSDFLKEILRRISFREKLKGRMLKIVSEDLKLKFEVDCKQAVILNKN